MDGAEQFLTRLRLSLHRYNFPPGRNLSYYESYEYDRMRRMANVAQALWFAKNKLPSAVRTETGEALDEVLSGILPALLMALVIVAGSSLVGASIGAIAGGFFGLGVGAVPGAIAGGSTGFTAGMWILEWMGLAFLAVHVGKNMYQVGRLLESGFNDAWGWGARDRHHTDFMPGNWKRSYSSTYGRGGYSSHVSHGQLSDVPGFSAVTRASEKFAQAVAVLIRLVLEGIVLYLTARGIAKLPELVAQLRNSRLGAGFATWVENNHLRLMNNPKLKQTAGSGGGTEKPIRVLDHTGVPEQPRPGKKKVTKAGKEKLRPGSPEHKAARWEEYQKRKNSNWDYDRWSKQYDTNMKNYSRGLEREGKYRDAMGGTDETLKTIHTYRQIDIYKADENYAGQLKTGKESLTKENVLAIKKDADLVDQGYTVEHILEKGATQPYLDALDEAGISYKIGPQIP